MKNWFGLIPFFLLILGASGAEIPIDPSRFQLQVDKGAEARSAIVDDETQPGSKELMVTVSKPGPEFWSVELRAPGFSFEQGKKYDLLFRARSSQSEYVYFTLERTDGNQASIAKGTFLQLPEQPVDCTVEFEVQETTPAARLTISSLSVDQATFYFGGFKLIEK
ncbi:MAG: carbohydrate binding domain-containing protein [Verrucomicrobia bacterium]|nr:carbohydrate binding domain-containing protein [Verrucomicrobiota bacterium]